MSTIVLLSSSPPPTFARSPTPAGSSSPLPSTASLIQNRSPSRNRFRAKAGQRDGFSSSFSTARQVLMEKRGAENSPLTSPRRTRFRSSQEESFEKLATGNNFDAKAKKATFAAAELPQPAPIVQTKDVLPPTLAPTKNVVPAHESDGEAASKEVQDVIFLERAAARKTDWTPPKPQATKFVDERTVEYSAGYLNGMLSSFTYADSKAKTLEPRQYEAANPAKRRKVELPKNAALSRTVSAPTLLKTKSLTPKATSTRIRSPPKKALTITGLATSNYLGHDETEESPMMQYLTSTQAQLQDTSAEPGLETKIQKTKAAVKKLKASKKNQSKSLLLSPKSAIQTLDSQEEIFGSASQLAREESPTFLREIIEATKQSESFLPSSPMMSPQRTQAISVDNTPKAGISRFRRTKNLWSAAGRDDDNALLHVETVDLTDSPAVRAAFAGKDVMLQPGINKPEFKSAPSLRGGSSPLAPNHPVTIADIDDVLTPNAISTRNLSTTATAASPRRSKSHVQPESNNAKAVSEQNASLQPKDVPPRPNYAGLTIHELNKLIKSYGFKAMRKREKMIELLDRCWEEKYGVTIPEAAEPEIAPFGDFLSKVHDISARPGPKIKKARVRKIKDVIGKDPDKEKAKKPRQRKKKEPDGNIEAGMPEKPKAKRSRKAKVTLVDDLTIPDIDLVIDTIPEELRALEAFEDWAKPEREPKPQVRQESPATEAMPDILKLPTPPTTLQSSDGSIPTPAAKAKTTNQASRLIQPIDAEATPSATPKSKPIDIQITTAIMHQSKLPHPGRNHNINPTWHEKILLYDPIILEDLATWLNTEGLAAIGEDKEVSALEVREWLESRGICCLWRGGWRGNKAAQS